MRFSWLLSIAILCLCLASELTTVLLPGSAFRHAVIFLFLFVCPGLVLVRFLHLKERLVEWTLAVALSLSLDMAIASIQLYAGWWSPATTLNIIVALCLLGLCAQSLIALQEKTYYV